jgi:hypothetical protein
LSCSISAFSAGVRGAVELSTGVDGGHDDGLADSTAGEAGLEEKLDNTVPGSLGRATFWQIVVCRFTRFCIPP